MYGEIGIEKDILFIATAENDESDEEYLRLFAHKEDADLWVMLSKLDGETESLRLVSVEPIIPREARAQFFEREKTPMDLAFSLTSPLHHLEPLDGQRLILTSRILPVP